MTFRNKLFITLLVSTLFLFAATSKAEVIIPAQPVNYVVDLADIISSATEANLNNYLKELEQKTTAQMVVLTLPGLEGESLEELSLTIAHDRWRLGQKGKDNGVLLLVALADRKYRFEIGYGLEGILPVSLVGSVGRQYLVPYFRKGDYSNGIFAASLAVISEIASDAGVEITGMPKLQRRFDYQDGGKGGRKPSLLGTVVSILFFIGMLYMFIKHPRLMLFFLVMNMLGGGRRSGWSGGGGFGGGGFGGGGGGGFGGGGASGGW